MALCFCVPISLVFAGAKYFLPVLKYVRRWLRCRLSNREVSFIYIYMLLLCVLLSCCCCFSSSAAASCCWSSSCARWPNLVMVHWIWSQCLFLFIQTRLIFMYALAVLCHIYGLDLPTSSLGNCRHARSQGGPQPAAAKPPLCTCICKAPLGEVPRGVAQERNVNHPTCAIILIQRTVWSTCTYDNTWYIC